MKIIKVDDKIVTMELDWEDLVLVSSALKATVAVYEKMAPLASAYPLMSRMRDLDGYFVKGTAMVAKKIYEWEGKK